MQNDDRLTHRALFGYAVSAAPVIYSYVLIMIMYMKYAAVELHLSTALIGTIFLFARCMDAITDPLVGNLSDRTTHRSGRRRPWLLAAAPLLAVFVVMAWIPPANLEGAALTAWIAIAIIGFYTAYTMFEVPHMSLGAELSLDASERNRIFSVRQVLRTLGMLVAFVVGSTVVERGIDATQSMIWIVAATTIVLILWGVRMLPRERTDFQGRGGENPLQAVRDVVANPHARLLLFVLFIDQVGVGGIGVLTPFVVDFVVGRPDLIGVLLGSNMLASLLAIPVWLRLARRFEKRRLMLASMFVAAIGYGTVLFVGPGDWPIVLFGSLLIGTASACTGVLGYTLKSEIIDCDEHRTGERKEGVYFAGWSFVSKLAAGVMVGVVGWAMAWAGFDGQAETQSALAQRTMVALMGGLPLVCYLIGAAAFTRFSLSEAEHARIRAELDARAEARPTA